MDSEIPKMYELEEMVFAINNEKSFETIALEIYRYQFHANSIYGRYNTILGKNPGVVNKLSEIPFLPISFFKTQRIFTDTEPELIFESSGTTGMNNSFHYVKNKMVYERSFKQCFELFYGSIDQYCILGLLPSYLERGNSSLVYMVNSLIQQSKHPKSGFYLHEMENLHLNLEGLKNDKQKIILFGVTYALLDFAKHFPFEYNDLIIIETGGMKGRGKELTRQEVKDQLQMAFSRSMINSEYGMTELLSQGYSINGYYKTPPWMKILIRDETDPLSLKPDGQIATGAINVIDLANIYSCSFIATEDIGKLYENGSFEVLGRLDNTDIRGCSLLTV